MERSELGYNQAMRRALYLATCVATLSFLLALPAWAQRRGGGGGGAHFSSHGGTVAHSSGSFHGGSVGHSYGIHSSGIHSSGVRIRTVNPYHRRGYYRRGYPYFAYGGYYPFGYYDNPLYDAGDQDAYAGVAANPDPSVNDSGLRNDVQALNDKVDRMQADAEARNRPVEQEPATALVFRDQHVEEVHNYAIAGETLWVLSDHQAGKKIPLAQLDIPATIRMNDDRGVDFQVPR